MWKAGVWSSTIFLFANTGCQEHASLPSCESPVELRVLEQDILDLIGTPSCQQASQCRSIAFGAKPCGGPWRYFIYSTATVDSAEVEQRVTRYNSLNERLNQECGWVSDCALVLEPHLECREGICVPEE